MAVKYRSRGIEGFEGFDEDPTTLFVDDFFKMADGTARTGYGYARMRKLIGTSGVNNSYIFGFREEDAPTNTVASGDWLLGRCRFFMRIKEITGTGAVKVGGMGYTALQYDARGLEINPATLKWRVNDFGTSAYSDEPLPLNEWLEVSLTLQGRSSNGSPTLSITCNGQTLSASPGVVPLSNTNMGVIGDTSDLTAAWIIDIDDLVYWLEVNPSADGAYPVFDFPTATHVKIVKIKYSGQTQTWSEAANIYWIRRTSAASNYIQTSSGGVSQPFYFHTEESDYDARGLVALDVCAWTQQGGGRTATVDLFGLSTITWSPGTSIGPSHVMVACNEADLLQPVTWTTGMTGSTFRMSGIWGNGLFETDLNPPAGGAEFLDYGDYWSEGTSTAKEAFRALRGVYTGSETPQKISLPFRPLAVLIREYGNTNVCRFVLATDLAGGTSFGFHFGLTASNTDAVTDMLGDGFVVGYHTSAMYGVNKAGCTYEYVALTDRGGGVGGRLLQASYIYPDAKDPALTQVAVPLDFQPGLILLASSGGSGVIWASPWGHDVLPANGTAVSGYITNVSPSGFLFSEASTSYFANTQFVSVSFSSALLDLFFSAGEYTGNGAIRTISTPDLPKWLWFEQSTSHTGQADSAYWVQSFAQGYYQAWTGIGNPASDSTRIRNVGDTSVEVGTNLSVAGRVYDWLALTGDYQQTQVMGGGFPPAKTLIVSPTRGTVLSHGIVPTLANGSLFSSAYPLSNLTDGYGRTVCRLSTPYGRIVLDLGAAYIPDLLAVVNHNLDAGLVLGVKGSNNSDLSSPALVAGFAATSDPVIWLDLRGFAFSACRYWGIEVTEAEPNSVGLAFGDILIATADAFEGVIDPDHEVQGRTFRERSFTEYGLPYSISSGARQRGLRLGLTLFTDEMDSVEAIFDDAGTNGRRVLVIPDSRVHEAYYVEWASQLDRARENQWVEKGSLELQEESFGVLHKGL